MPADLDPPPLSAALAAENRELRAALAKALAKALARIAELEARLGLSSKNSSKPPSSDGLAKPPSRSLRARGRRKPGGQPGHPGQTLAQVAVADEVVRHEPVACTGCGRALTTAPEAGTEVRQVFDLPPVRVWVTEHRLVKRRCGCGRITSGQAPVGVDARCGTARGSARSVSTCTSASCCPSSGPPWRWPSCLACRCRRGRSR